MMRPGDFYTKRDYSIYLVAKAVDLVLYVIALVLLVIPCIVGMVAEWCVDVASALCGSVHSTRRSAAAAVADRLSRFVSTEPPESQAMTAIQLPVHGGMTKPPVVLVTEEIRAQILGDVVQRVEALDGRCSDIEALHNIEAGIPAAADKPAPCGGSRCYKTDLGWTHSSKSYDSCCVNRGEPESADHPAGDDAEEEIIKRICRGDVRVNDVARLANTIATLRANLAQAEHQRDALKPLLQQCLGYVPSELESDICEHL